MDGFSIWNPAEIETGRCVSWKLGKLSLWAERYEREWHVLPLYAEEELEPTFDSDAKKDKPVSSEWRHYVLREGGWAVPRPAMPDRAVILRPDRILVLLPGERACFFLPLPLWFRLMIGPAPESGKTLIELPIEPQPNAWFGDPISGELCYFSSSRLYPDVSAIPPSPFNAVCPLQISNESDKELSFDRICLHTEFLGVYHGESRFWTNEVNVVVRGADQATQIQPAKGPPDLDGVCRTLAPPRQVAENWYFKRTFDRLKYFTGF